jgi:Ni2+-binding GTPase involved in maturation of urease and hydrogenase
MDTTPPKIKGEDFNFLTPVSGSFSLAEPLVKKISDATPSQIIVIGIAGGSGSGKTTLAKAIYETIGEENITFISHDSYYRDLRHLTVEQRAQHSGLPGHGAAHHAHISPEERKVRVGALVRLHHAQPY